MTRSTKTPPRTSAATRKTAAKPAATARAARAKKPEPEAIEEPVPVSPMAEPENVAEAATAEIAEATESVAEAATDITEETKAIISDEPTAETIVEPVEMAEQKGTELMSDVIETTKKYTDEAKERFQSAFAEMSEKAKAGVEKSTKAFEELNDIAKGNVEAFVESGKIASKGLESIGQEAAEYGRVSFEKASAAMKSLAAVKSPTEFFQLQSELLSGAFDAFAKESAKNSEAMLKLAGDVAQPISTRVSVVTEKVRSIAA